MGVDGIKRNGASFKQWHDKARSPIEGGMVTMAICFGTMHVLDGNVCLRLAELSYFDGA